MLDFIGIGGQRCGTTWLYRNLRRHPMIKFPAGKEVDFWKEEVGLDPALWLARFPPAADRVKQGDITPAYAICPDGVVAEIAAAVPDARLVLNIRNPIKRSWSAALLFAHFAQMDPDEPTDAWFLEVLRSWRCQAKSTFTTTIERWEKAFSAEQLRLVVYDDIIDDPVTVMRTVADHIGVDPTFYTSKRAMLGSRWGRQTSRTRAPSAATVEVLRELHDAEITRLETILSRDLGHWRRWDGS